MSAPTGATLARLRHGLDPLNPALVPLYEQWLASDAWPVEVALALIVGLDPAAWATHISHHELEIDAAALRAALQSELGSGRHAELIAVGDLAAWMTRHAWTWPAAAAALLEFIARTLPSTRLAGISATPCAADAERRAVTGRTRSSRLDIPSSMPASLYTACGPSQRDFHALATNTGETCGLAVPPAVSAASDREAVLGAALALATRFTERCLDPQGHYDARRMVRALRSQAAVVERLPDFDEAAMIDLLERYLPAR